MAVILGLFGSVLYATLRQTLEAELDRRLQVRGSQVELAIWAGPRALAPTDIAAVPIDLSPLTTLDAPNVYVEVLDRDGQAVAASDNLRGATLPLDPGILQAA